MSPPATSEDDPFDQLRDWLVDAACEPMIRYPRAACLATVDTSGRPDARIVLVHAIEEDTLLFATDARSPKARQLAAVPQAALVFHWEALERQVRLRGSVLRAGDADADRGFVDRPRRSRITTWASVQSRPLPDPTSLTRAYERAAEEHRDADPVPRPDTWVAFRLRPLEIELWSAGACRLHHRTLYRRDGDRWRRTRLEP